MNGVGTMIATAKVTARPTEYLADACRINGATPEQVFGRPLRHSRGESRRRWACMKLAKELADDDTLSFSATEWANATGMCETAIRHILTRNVQRSVAIRTIIWSACKVCGIVPDQLDGPGRHPNVVNARMLITVAARQLTIMSYPEIATAINRPNHSTVITAHQRYDRLTANHQRLDLAEMLEAVIHDSLFAMRAAGEAA